MSAMLRTNSMQKSKEAKRALERTTLRTMPNGKFRSELCQEGFDPDALAHADAHLDCDITGAKVSVEDVRLGKFELIDPVSGQLHYHPPGGWTTQVAYLNVLKRPFLVLPPPFGFDPLMAVLLRGGITNGLLWLKGVLKTYLDSMALLGALLLVLTFELGQIDYYDSQDCTQSSFARDTCNLQVWCGACATATGLLLMTYCVLVGCVIDSWPHESICVKLRHYMLFILYVPTFSLFFIGAWTSFALIIKLAKQTEGYDDRFEWSWSDPTGIFGVTNGVWMAWGLVMLMAMIVFYFLAGHELRNRDLNLGDRWSLFLCWNSDVGFSDEFLVQVGVMSQSSDDTAVQSLNQQNPELTSTLRSLQLGIQNLNNNNQGHEELTSTLKSLQGEIAANRQVHSKILQSIAEHDEAQTPVQLGLEQNTQPVEQQARPAAAAAVATTQPPIYSAEVTSGEVTQAQWEAMDANQDGFVSLQEQRAWLSQNAGQVTLEQWKTMDTNKDGRVTVEEQQAWMAQNMEKNKIQAQPVQSPPNPLPNQEIGFC